MKNLDLNQIHLCLENDVNHLVQSILFTQSDAAKIDAHDAVLILEPEIDAYIVQLNEKKLSFGEFDSLLLKKKEAIELSTLKENGVSPLELEMIRFGIIHVICDTVFSCMVDMDGARHHDYVVEKGLETKYGSC